MKTETFVYVMDRIKPRGIDALPHVRSYVEDRDVVVDLVTSERFSFRDTVGRGNIGPILEARAKAIR